MLDNMLCCGVLLCSWRSEPCHGSSSRLVGGWCVTAEAGRLPVGSAAAQSPEELGWLSGETGTTVPVGMA